MTKEYCEKSHTAVIRDENYGSQLEKFIEFYNEALKDFPNLNASQVRIVKYGGRRYANTFGIEFEARGVPNYYTRIGQLEYEASGQ